MMVENESLADLLNKSANTPQNSTHISLISAERAAKFELLIHLLSNLSEAIVISGAKGMGKTTWLKFVQAQNNEAWFCCPLVGSPELNFGLFQEKLAQFIKQNTVKAEMTSLTGMFQQLNQQHKKLLLLIDDAGNTPPGFISQLIEYVDANPMLRVVFALTHDEFFLKSSSDKLIDVCHVIEIPPLSEKQCGDFLHLLATSTCRELAYKSINEQMIKTIFAQSHGVPGKIIEQIPLLARTRTKGKPLWILMLLIIALIALAINKQWLETSKNFFTAFTTFISIDSKIINSEQLELPVNPKK